MKKYLTSFAALKVAEGTRLVGTYSIVDDNGEYISQNQRFSKLVMDNEIENAVAVIEAHLTASIPE